MDTTKIRVSKLDAAQRQLDAAIEMWFYEREPVAVHTLAAAAYQVIHDINQHKQTGVDLLYDSVVIKDEHRKEFNDAVRKPINFFKHADNDPDGIIEFPIESSLLFFIFSMRGLQALGQRPSNITNVLANWILINRPELTTAEWRQRMSQGVPLEGLEKLRAMPRPEYFEAALRISSAKRHG